MLYDQVLNLPHRWYRQCQADLSSGVPPTNFNAKIMKAAMPFRIDDVASHYYNHPADYVPDDFHNLAPRFPIMWFEFTQPKRGLIGDTWNDYEAALKEAVGDQLDITKFVRGIFVRSWDRYDEADAKAFSSFKIKEQVRWLYRAMVFLSLDGVHVSDIFSGMTWQVDGKGEIVYVMGEKGPYIYDIPKVLVASVGIEEIKGHITGSVMPVIMTLALIQHKDVSVGTVPARKKKKKVKAGTRRARRAAKKLPRDSSFYEHHIIQVNPLKPGREFGEGQPSEKKRHLAQHQVSGGFRTYGGEDPVTGRQRGLLFGKRACTIFVPAYERGTNEDGTITKEFEVHNE